MIEGIGSVFSTSGESNAQKAADSFNLQAEQYLNIFLTSLKYQDPDEPLKAKELTEQLSSITNTQQIIELNSSVEELLAMQTTSQASSIASFIGKNVEYLGNVVPITGAGGASFSYVVDGNYESSVIEIRDSSNRVVYSTTGESAQGNYEFSWDGKNSLGETVPDGNYTVNVAAKNAAGDLIDMDVLARGKVSGVDFSSPEDGPVLSLGKSQNAIVVELSKISSITDSESSNLFNF